MKFFPLLLSIASLIQLSISHVRIDQLKYRRLNRHRPIHASRRSLVSETDPEMLELQRLWWEWNFCTNAYPNETFTEMTDIVPENILFLSKHRNGFKSDNVTCNGPLTRTATINTGKQKILMPAWIAIFYDYSDDYKDGICSNSPAESEALRHEDAEANAMFKKDPINTPLMVFKVDDVSQDPFFIYDNRSYFLVGCPDNRTNEQYETLNGDSGDPCDPTSPFQQFNGMDVYPLLGWWGIYNHTWHQNETHTFEFGYFGKECNTVKYVLTAKDVCDFTIFGVEFCPFLWIKHLFQFLFSWMSG